MSSLTNEEFSELKEIYKNFKQDLNSAINNRNIINNKECCLIKKQWDTDIDTIFNKEIIITALIDLNLVDIDILI